MKVNYTEPFNFKPIPAITPMDGYWQNGTWKFGSLEITPDTAYEPSFIDVILKGNTALTLVNSKANSLEYLKLYGGCEQRNLPAGYTQVNGVTNASGGYIDTGIVADVDDMEYDIVATYTSSNNTSWYLLQSRANASASIYGISGSSSGNTFIGAFSGTNIAIPSSTIKRQDGHTYHVNFVCKNGTGTITVEDLTDDTTATETGTYTFTAATSNTGLFSNLVSTGILTDGYTYVLSAYIKKSGVKVMNYTSCTQSSVAGFYDKVTSSFKGATAGSFVAGTTTVPSPTQPVDIQSNNGAIKYGYLNKNLNYGDLDSVGYTSTGGTSNSSTFCGNLWKIKCEEGEKYTVSCGNFPDGISGVFVNTWKTDGTFNLRQAISMSTSYTYTIPSGIGWVNFTLYKTGGITIGDNSWIQVEKGNTATSYVKSEMGIYTVGTTETVQVTGKNLLNLNRDSATVSGLNVSTNNQTLTVTGTQNQSFANISLTNNGTAVNVASILTASSGVKKFNKGLTYTIKFSDYSDIYDVKIVKYDKSTQTTISLTNGVATFTPTYDVCDIWIRISGNNTARDISTTVQLEQGSTATTYEPYYNGGTATAEMLLKVGTYQDVQEVLTGNVTRNVGIKVFDGTEAITTWPNGNGFFYLENNMKGQTSGAGLSNFAPTVIQTNSYGIRYGTSNNKYIYFCQFQTELGISTVSDFQKWLKDKLENETPLIILYPLDTATTSSVTAQSLNIQAGTNIVEITQASIDGLELEAKYKAGVEVTIEEIEDAQLDNNVEVTIQ